MKEHDLLVDFIPQQLILYAEKDDGSYGPVQTGSNMAKNYLDDYWFKYKNLQSSLMKQLSDNEISSIHYYMTLLELAPAELASRVGIRTSRLKKHLKPQEFNNIRISLLNKYALVFNVPIANLFQIIVKRSESEQDIEQQSTKNRNIVITKIQEK
jgi:DNA-binding MarR family transcriptional regulator